MGECRSCAYNDRPIYKWPCDVCRATKNGRSMYCPEESDYIANDEGKTDYISRWEAQDAMTGENLIRNLDSVENGDAKRYARAAIRVLERLKPADVRPLKWIPVTERLPEQTPTRCLCYSKDGCMVGTYTSWGWMFPCYFEKVTHWMPLPEPPEGGVDR